jgi:hypothetical protein
LNSHTGWWNGVATGDVNGDGRPDIIASNWGRNSKFESYRRHPLRLFGADFDGNGSVESVEAHLDPDRMVWLPIQARHVAAQALPGLAGSFPTYESYARATLIELYGSALDAALVLQAHRLESTVFLNRGSHFEAVSLPLQAQLAPAFAVCVADMDGDGFQDVFLSQNFFAVHPEISRYDAGRGLWLQGDGRAGFRALSPGETGVAVYGEQRGAAVCDFDADGRVDLVVTQNSASTRLFRNAVARPGLRVRLVGPRGNPSAIGASLRAIGANGPGPLNEIQGGSGYLSQNSVIAVLTSPADDPIRSVWVRWPGGGTQTVAVPQAAREITVRMEGADLQNGRELGP